MDGTATTGMRPVLPAATLLRVRNIARRLGPPEPRPHSPDFNVFRELQQIAGNVPDGNGVCTGNAECTGLLCDCGSSCQDNFIDQDPFNWTQDEDSDDECQCCATILGHGTGPDGERMWPVAGPLCRGRDLAMVQSSPTPPPPPPSPAAANGDPFNESPTSSPKPLAREKQETPEPPTERCEQGQGGTNGRNIPAGAPTQPQAKTRGDSMAQPDDAQMWTATGKVPCTNPARPESHTDTPPHGGQVASRIAGGGGEQATTPRKIGCPGYGSVDSSDCGSHAGEPQRAYTRSQALGDRKRKRTCVT